MAFSTVAQAIAAAMRQIVPGYSTSSGDWSTVVADGMQALNLMLIDWALMPSGVYKVTRENFTLVDGTASYTIGPSATMNTARPLKIQKAFTRSSNIDYPIDVYYGVNEYAGETQKTLEARPTSLYMEQGTTTCTLLFYPTPDAAYDFHIWSFKGFTEYTSSSQSFGLGPQYEEPIKWNLALLLCEEMGKPVPQLIAARAADTLERLKRFHLPPQQQICTDIIGHSGGYDINTDEMS